MSSTIEIKHSGNQSWPITVKQNSNKKFSVMYGLDTEKDLSYSEACEKLGAALLHSLACDGQIDNSGK